MPFVLTPQVCPPPASTLPATVPAGAVAIEAPASPVGGAAAQAGPARLRARRAAAKAASAQGPSRVSVRAARALSMLPPLPLDQDTQTLLSPSWGPVRPYHRCCGGSTSRCRGRVNFPCKAGMAAGDSGVAGRPQPAAPGYGPARCAAGLTGDRLGWRLLGGCEVLGGVHRFSPLLGVLLLAIPASAGADHPAAAGRNGPEARIHATETTLLGPQHAAEHASQRAAQAHEARQLKRLSPSERRQIARRKTSARPNSSRRPARAPGRRARSAAGRGRPSRSPTSPSTPSCCPPAR